MKRLVLFLLCICVLLSFTGCVNKSDPVQVGGEIVHIADLSKDEEIPQDGYIIYLYGYVGDLMAVWVNEDTTLVSNESSMLWSDVLSRQQTGVWVSGTVHPTDVIQDGRLHNLFVAEELILKASTADSGGKFYE